MNTSFLSGNLGKDPELKYTQAGTPVVTYSLAVYRANPKEKDKPFTDWFNVVVWGEEPTRLVMSNLKKGTSVLITGKFQTRTYDDKDGKKVYVTEFWQDNFWVAPSREKKEEKTDDFSQPFNQDELPF